MASCQRASPDQQITNKNHPTPHEYLISYLSRLPTVKEVETWPLPEIIADRSRDGLKITTIHYQICTTLSDPLILRQVPVFMESAFQSYCEIIGTSLTPEKKLAVYLFGDRQQWEQFSSFWTQNLAPIYLKIKSGAYYLNGACVAYHIGRKSNFSVLAHEGWHQFSDELFELRLPAWLDEGIATNCEAFDWKNGRVIFDARTNGARLMGLSHTLARDNFIPLSDLLSLDAGRVLSHISTTTDDAKTDPRIVAYYAQIYALTRFLREAGYGRYLYHFQTMVNDARLGQWRLEPQDRDEATQREHNPSRRWNAKVGRQIFETYIASNLLDIEPAYRAFCRKILANVRFQKSP